MAESVKVQSGILRWFKQTKWPPGPKEIIPIWSMARFRSNYLTILADMKAKYGEVTRLRLWPMNAIFLSDPEDVKRVLVTEQANFTKPFGIQRVKLVLGEGLLTSEGECHQRQRQLVQPAFHREALRNYAEVMIACAARARDSWQDGATCEMNHEMMRLTLGIIARTLFSANVDDAADEIGTSLTTLLEGFPRLLKPLAPLFIHLPLRENRKLFEARARLDRIIYSIIEERIASGETGTDLLGMLLASRDESGAGAMTPTQVRDEALTIFLAGYETTAIGLSWTWMLLAQHPEVRERLDAELREVLKGRTPAYEDYPKLVYARKVFQEVLRLYPPAYTVNRGLRQACEFGGYTIPAKRTIILLSPYHMHRDPRFYANPERFDPSRWTPEFEAGLPKFAYFPFGGGPRICIGANFAWMEAVLVIATLAQHWRPQLIPGQQIELSPKITLRPSPGISMKLKKIT